MQVQWQRYLSRQRLGQPQTDNHNHYRTDFQKDFDRLIFCTAFRRLQDKTQVFPLSRSDYIRTRLTHSLEVSSVARSLGVKAGEYLIARHQLQGVEASDVGTIIAAAALAHDLGNPPFGHAGEEAISRWFVDSAFGRQLIEQIPIPLRNDFLKFEGNAQGFRLITRLQNADNKGGLQLTLATLGAFLKYPCNSHQSADLFHAYNGHVAFKKYNYFAAEQEHMQAVAEGLQLKSAGKDAWHRHPLSYLLEAADDICYRIIDVEDAYRLGLIAGEQVIALFTPIAYADGCYESAHIKLNRMRREKDRVEYLRARAIGSLIDQVSIVFQQQEEALLAGTCHSELLALIPSAEPMQRLKTLGFESIYIAPPVLEVGIAGFEVLTRLLDAFAHCVEDQAQQRPSSRSRMLFNMLPDQFIGEGRIPAPDTYTRILRVTDFLSGMTDSYAVSLFKTITGMALP